MPDVWIPVKTALGLPTEVVDLRTRMERWLARLKNYPLAYVYKPGPGNWGGVMKSVRQMIDSDIAAFPALAEGVDVDAMIAEYSRDGWDFISKALIDPSGRLDAGLVGFHLGEYDYPLDMSRFKPVAPTAPVTVDPYNADANPVPSTPASNWVWTQELVGARWREARFGGRPWHTAPFYNPPTPPSAPFA